MPTTPAERKALMFLGAVAVLGVGARVVAKVRGGGDHVGAMQPALERQLARAEGEARRAKVERAEREAGKGKKKEKTGKKPGTQSAARRRSRDSSATATGGATASVIDIDTADTLQLATLPGVGPGLARRIVEDRARHGAFGGAAALDQVPGVGPRLLERLAPRVTFSGPPRPIHGKSPADGATGRGMSHAAGRRRRATR